MVTKSPFHEVCSDGVIKLYLCEHTCSHKPASIMKYNTVIQYLGTTITEYLPEISYKVCDTGRPYLKQLQ